MKDFSKIVMHKKILIIAGFDPTGNAGLLKDSEICKIHGYKSFVWPTALACQTDTRYLKTFPTPISHLKVLWNNLPKSKIAAVKIGMLCNEDIVRFVSSTLKQLRKINPKLPIIWDPVLFSSSGGKLLSDKGLKLALREILPLLTVITPNAVELCQLTNTKFKSNLDAKKLSHIFFKMWHVPVYLKGGHLNTKSKDVFFDGVQFAIYSSKVSAKKIRGTGCTHATALACNLSRKMSLKMALHKSKIFMSKIFSCKKIMKAPLIGN